MQERCATHHSQSLWLEVGDENLPAVSDAVSYVIPAIPINLVTRLRLEILVMRSSVMDLRHIAETILADAGATLQLLRVIGEEYGSDSCRPSRIEHCIAVLDRDRWFHSVCASVISSHHKDISAVWEQFRKAGQSARLIAERTNDFVPEEAYLVGMLHQIGKLPHILGWTSQSCYSVAEERAVGVLLAQHWCVPAFLMESLLEQQDEAFRARWSGLLHAAQWESIHQQEYRTGSKHSRCLSASGL